VGAFQKSENPGRFFTIFSNPEFPKIQWSKKVGSFSFFAENEEVMEMTAFE